MTTPPRTTPRRIDRDPVLVVSVDPQHSDVRRRILEEAGFEVVAVSDMNSLMEACKTHRFGLAVIGFSIPPAEKARIAQQMRMECYRYIPTLELYSGLLPEMDGVAFSFRQLSSSQPDAFLAAVRAICEGDYNVEQPTGS